MIITLAPACDAFICVNRHQNAGTYRLQLNNNANVNISSVGPSDVTATITEDKTGAIIERDDDSGKGYNFSISKALKAGAYILEVRHCCAGTGAFGLKFETKTNK